MTRHAYHAYRGAILWRATEPGARLRWTAVVDGRQYAADTLAGIRSLVRDATR